MAQGLADVVHGNAFGVGNAGEAVAQAVEGERGQAMFADKADEQLGGVVWPHGAAVLVSDHVALPAVGVPQIVPVLLLTRLFPAQGVLQGGGHMESAPGGLCFRFLFHHQLPRGGAYRLDVDFSLLEVHTGPGEAQNFLPPQSQQPGQLDNHLQPGAAAELEQLLKLLHVVKVNLRPLYLGRVHPLGGVGEDDPLAYRHFQCGVEQVVMLSGRVGAEPLVTDEEGVVLLELLRGEPL